MGWEQNYISVASSSVKWRVCNHLPSCTIFTCWVFLFLFLLCRVGKSVQVITCHEHFYLIIRPWWIKDKLSCAPLDKHFQGGKEFHPVGGGTQDTQRNKKPKQTYGVIQVSLRQPNLSRNDDVNKMFLAKNTHCRLVARSHIHVSCEYVKVLYILPERPRNLPWFGELSL